MTTKQFTSADAEKLAVSISKRGVSLEKDIQKLAVFCVSKLNADGNITPTINTLATLRDSKSRLVKNWAEALENFVVHHSYILKNEETGELKVDKDRRKQGNAPEIGEDTVTSFKKAKDKAAFDLSKYAASIAKKLQAQGVTPEQLVNAMAASVTGES